MQERRQAGVSEGLLTHVSIGEFGGRYRNAASCIGRINDSPAKSHRLWLATLTIVQLATSTASLPVWLDLVELFDSRAEWQNDFATLCFLVTDCGLCDWHVSGRMFRLVNYVGAN